MNPTDCLLHWELDRMRSRMNNEISLMVTLSNQYSLNESTLSTIDQECGSDTVT